MHSFGFIVALGSLSAFLPATCMAACSTPQGAVGSIFYNLDTGIQSRCDGTNWSVVTEYVASKSSVGQRMQIATDSGPCTTAKLGRLRYDGITSWEYCNGSEWSVMGAVSLNGLSDSSADYTTTFNMYLGGGGASTTSGTHNIAVGHNALLANASGSYAVAIGQGALFDNTIGNANVAVGQAALGVNTVGNNNTGIGGRALAANVIASNSTAVGYYALAKSTGAGNTALGVNAGDNLTSGSHNIVIGNDIDAPAATSSNTLTIGNLIYGTGLTSTGTTASTGKVGIGLPSPAVALDVKGDIQYTGTISDVSDRRLKADIKPLSARGSMLQEVLGLPLYSFVMKADSEQRIEFGVMGQDLQRVFPELVTRSNGSPEGYLAVNYLGLIAPILGAIQEQQAIIDRQQRQIDLLMEKAGTIPSR